MPIGHKDHRRIPMAPAVALGRVHQPLDLGLGQVLARAQLAVRWPFGGDCSIYGGWRDQPEVPLGHTLRAPGVTDCSYNAPISNAPVEIKSCAATVDQGLFWPF